MAQKWYYSQDGAQYGPVEESEIIRLIQESDLDPGAPVLMKGSNDWSSAREHACFRVKVIQPSQSQVAPTSVRPTTQPPRSQNAIPPVVPKTTMQPMAGYRQPPLWADPTVAKSRVKGPSICLLIFGAIWLVFVVIGGIAILIEES
jgi:hypothetical protein